MSDVNRADHGAPVQDAETPAAPFEDSAANAKMDETYFDALEAAAHVRYPNMKMEHEESLPEFLNMHINNVGDPFNEGTNRSYSKFEERAVLDYFALLWNAKSTHDDGTPGKPGVDEMDS